jgi:DNA processing protein
MSEDRLLHWLALSLLNVAPASIATALARTGGAPDAALAEILDPRGMGQAPLLFDAGVSEGDAGHLLDPRGVKAKAPLALEACRRAQITAIPLDDPAYPSLLRQIPDPPPVLYALGTLLPDDDPAVAIVGSRRATPYGIAVARSFGHTLGESGVTVISGLARGIDAAAHAGVLSSATGRGLAVLGCGLDRIYPPEHGALARSLLARGALLSEFPPGVPPYPQNFPRRNRIISGLSRGVVVVEAAEGSGSLITAGLALEQGREVFAVPGPITAETSRGVNDLLRQGARPATSVLEVVEELPAALRDRVARRLAARRAGPPPDLTPAERLAWEALDPAQPRTTEEVALATGLGVAALLSALLGLEMRQLALSLPGSRYLRGDWTGGPLSLY